MRILHGIFQSSLKKAFCFFALLFASIFGHTENSPFFFSSEEIVQEKQDPLKGMHAFVFFPLLKIEEKNANKIIELMDRELGKVGLLIKKPILTPEGADLDSFSNPTLRFTIEQLVDKNNHPLPVLHAILSVSTVTELSVTRECTSLNIHRWSMYLEKTNDVQGVIKQALPYLLKQFTADFYEANPSDQKPTFHIIYDSSWWATRMHE